MDDAWSSLRDHFTAACSRIQWQGDSGRILVPSTPLCFRWQTDEPDDWDYVEDWLSELVLDVYNEHGLRSWQTGSALQRATWRVVSLLRADWDGLATSSWATLDVWLAGRTQGVAVVCFDDAPVIPIGLLDIRTTAIAEPLATWAITSGHFGHLPTRLYNYQPDVINRRALATAYRTMLDDDEGWGALRDGWITRAEHPDTKQAFLAALQALRAGPEAMLLRHAQEAAEMTSEDKDLTLGLYLDQAYLEDHSDSRWTLGGVSGKGPGVQ